MDTHNPPIALRSGLCLVLSALAAFGSASALTITNPNFDPPAENPDDNPSPGYGPVSGWTRSGTNSGVNPCATGTTQFLNGLTAHSGTHVAFIQNSGNISQAVSGFDPAKPYTVTYFVNERGNSGAATSTSVSLDGGTTYHAETGNIARTHRFRRVVSGPLAVSASTSTLEIKSTAISGDNALLIDTVSVSRALPFIADGGFENPVQPDTNQTSRYELGNGSGGGTLVGSAWDFGSSISGIVRNGSAFNPYAEIYAAEGSQSAILRDASEFSTTVNGFEAGVSYRLSFQARGRTEAGGPNVTTVKLGDLTLGFGGGTSITPAGIWTTYTTDPFTTAGGALTLTFQGLTAGDKSTFIDDVRFVFVADAATVADPIVLVNLPATHIAANSATLSGVISVPETDAEVRVYWGESNGGTNPAAWSHSALVGTYTNLVAADLFFPVTGLDVLTNYHYAFRASNDSLDVWAQPGTTFSTTVPASGDYLLGILQALDGHIKGTVPLTTSEIADYCQVIIDSKANLDSDAATIAATLDLVRTYDSMVGPLFVSGSPKASGFNRGSLVVDIHWTVYNVMQGIMDVVYDNPNLATHSGLLEEFKFGSSSNFPGACPPPSDPANVHVARIDASFVDGGGWPVFHWDLPARKPTGTYLAPGTFAFVTVPASLINQGYRIRVGAHAWDMSARPPVKRLERATIAYEIDQNTVKIASPLGGGIYIEVPLGADHGVVDVSIQGAVRSPFFSSKAFHTTTPAEWLVERAHPGPWADFQSEKYMMQVPRSWIYALPDPTAMMRDWDSAQDSVNDLMGFPRIRGKEAMYAQVDVISRNSVYSPGYPMVNTTYNPNTNYGGNHNHFLVRGPRTGWDVQFHEQGHGYLFMKFSGETESAVNLLYLPVLLDFGVPMETAFPGSMGAGSNRSLTNTAITWMTMFNFSSPFSPMITGHKAYQLKGHAKFADIMHLFGTGAVSRYYKSYVDDYDSGVPKQSLNTTNDEQIFRLCKAADRDLTPLLKFWGIWPQNAATLASRIAAANLPESAEIYQRLLFYRSIIPAGNAAYRSFTQTWHGRVPGIGGNLEERDHARQYDSTPLFAQAGDIYRGTDPAQADGEIYTEATRARIVAVIDSLLASYFPDGDPALQNQPPKFAADPFDEANATQDIPYTGSLAGRASDPDGDPLVFSKVSGPAWLQVAAAGTLSGTPLNSNIGVNQFTVRVSGGNLADSATLRITVMNVNDAPAWDSNPITAIANVNSALNLSIAGFASDADAGTYLSFAKISGPAWLGVASNGDLSGTPTAGDAGLNVFTVTVSDGIAPTVETTLHITVNQAQTAVPNVVGLPQATATADISSASLVVGSVMVQYNNSVTSGHIVSQSPAAGSLVYFDSAVNLILSRGPLPENTPLIANPDFDPPAEDSSDNPSPGYGPISQWDRSSNNSGVNDSSLPFLNQAAHSGTHAAFIQGSSHISQALTGFDPSQLYTVTYFVSERGLSGAATSTSVSLDGGATSFSLPESVRKTARFRRVVSGPLAVSGATSTLQIRSTSVSGDSSLLIDTVSVSRAVPSVPDSGFENPVQPGTGASGYKTGDGGGSGTLTGSLWDFSSGGSGITLNGSSFSTVVDAAPEGSQAALLRSTSGFFTSVSGFETGVTYSLSFDAKGRSSTFGPNVIQVRLGDEILSFSGNPSLTPGQSAWATFTTDPFVTAGGTLELTFTGLTAGDKTTFLDDIRLNYVTEVAGNEAPFFDADPVVMAVGTAGSAYNGTLADRATDADGDPVTFAKLSGPTWLTVAADGTLSGTPGESDVGLNTYSISASDGIAPPVQATLNLTVLGAGGGPTFADYISNPAFGLDPSQQAFNDDPDGDGLANGLEAWFGTHPGEFNAGITNVTRNGNTITFTHPRNENAPTDISGYYEWSPDLVDWYAGDGVDGPLGSPTMVISSESTDTTTTVTVTSSLPVGCVFLRAGVLRN